MRIVDGETPGRGRRRERRHDALPGGDEEMRDVRGYCGPCRECDEPEPLEIRGGPNRMSLSFLHWAR